MTATGCTSARAHERAVKTACEEKGFIQAETDSSGPLFDCHLHRPFAGALVPMDFYRSDAKRVHSIMIEINRGVYMDEETGEKLPTFDQVKDKVGKAIVELLSFTRQRINT